MSESVGYYCTMNLVDNRQKAFDFVSMMLQFADQDVRSLCMWLLQVFFI